ncbi:baculoviral IAP repeat-containing protein 1 isoform X2 [Hemicordylus capensis]|uniref:baculoviral IAP repeat-containing protein 1 isoform X2 n=1 Tax=Hemicordylus capensis TaxID=884348 RepID=UPI002304817A|nr:baculoviral IAP repeat-containing protein 1 isoform X2 [Hemicordylus capensis]
MATQETSAEDCSVSELDLSYLEARYPNWNYDFKKHAEELEEEFQQIRKQLQRGFNPTMRSETQRLKTFLNQPGNFRSAWCPSEMAAAGFSHTGVKSAIQCFCCGLVLLARGIKTPPSVEHKKHRPECEFILGKEVGNISMYEVRVQNPETSSAEIRRGALQKPLNYAEVEARLESFGGWPFYASETMPALLASAGFFFTGIKDTVRCFACDGCLGNWEEGDDPWKEHAKWFPECEFLQKEKSREEIKEYIQNYYRFFGIMGKHFEASFGTLLPSNTGDSEPNINIYEDEDVRLDSFKTWPQDALADATALAKVGFFFTGSKDIVQCFACGGRLVEWKEDDDPWKEHARCFPDCKQSDMGRNVSLEQPLRQSLHDQQTDCKDNLEQTEALCSAVTNVAFDEHKWLREQLSSAYNDMNFRKMFSFGESSHFAIDLKLLHGDLSIVSKDISNQPLQQLLLPEVLESFHSVTVLEGEAGSGKTALLRKIAILWASGCCPILSRFKFVFYLSLSSAGRDQSLAGIIGNQLVKCKGPFTEDSLKNICQLFKNQVLFLLDDYDEENTVPQVIGDLIQKNHFSKHCLVIAVRTNRISGIRHYANMILSIAEFPLSSTLYLLRKLFSHNIELVEKFFIQMVQEEAMQSMFKTPLFVVALGTYWVQYPSGNMFTDMVILKAYLLYSSLKYPRESDRLKAMVSACGELALRGLFNSHFDFNDEDLCESGVNGDDAVWFGLLSKFTAQRLRPLYKFFHLSFQEFLAGLRLSELLGSDVQEDVEKGLQYLQQIDTFVKISGRYQYILRYACSETFKAVPKIISHLLNLLSCERSFESSSENDVYLQQTPKLQLMQLQLFIIAVRLCPESQHSECIRIVLDLTTELAYQSNMVPACAPLIFQFLTGKEFPLSLFASESGFITRFFLDYPESLFLPSKFKACLTGKQENIDLSLAESCYAKMGTPVVNQEYAPAFTLFSDMTRQLKEDEDLVNNFRMLIPRHVPDSKIVPFLHIKGNEKIPHLKFEVSNINSLQAPDLQNVVKLFSVFDHIELNLRNCHGLIESIKPAIEQNVESFKICSIHNGDLNVVEENLLLSMSSLQSLEIKGKTLRPETLLVNLDKYACLKELSVDLPDSQNIFDIIPEGFKNLQNMEKLLIDDVQFESSSSRLAAALPNFTGLKVLNLTRLKFTDKEACTSLTKALSHLVHLEELVLPIGEGIRYAAKRIVQQCIHFPNLRQLEFNECLSSEGLLEIPKVAADGGFQKLEVLRLKVNHSITEEAWRNFFQTLSIMPKLYMMDFDRLFEHQIKCQAATVKSFAQCVSRLPSLTTINMLGWLFDKEDLKMFDVMKEQHPQSKSLSLFWRWVLPVSPVIQE